MHPNALLPPRLELEAFRRSVNRKLWFAIGFLGMVALGCVLLALLAIIRPIPVLAFDAKGRPLLFEDTVKPRLQLSDLRIEYFAEQFLEKFVGIDSANISDDFSAALNMMTPRLRRIVIGEGKEFERKRKHQDSNLKSRFEEVTFTMAPTMRSFPRNASISSSSGRSSSHQSSVASRMPPRRSPSTSSRSWAWFVCPSGSCRSMVSRSTSCTRGSLNQGQRWRCPP